MVGEKQALEDTCDVTIPDQPVNLDGYAIVDGVAQGGAEDPAPKTEYVYPPISQGEKK